MKLQHSRDCIKMRAGAVRVRYVANNSRRSLMRWRGWIPKVNSGAECRLKNEGLTLEQVCEQK